MVSLSDNSANWDRDRSETLACPQKVSVVVEEAIIFVLLPLKQKYESPSCPALFVQVCGHSLIGSGNGLRFQKCRTQLWRDLRLGRQREACRFFRANGLLACTTIHDYFFSDLPRALAL